MFNKVILVGNLTRDIELRYTNGNMAIASTGLATNRVYKTQSGEQRNDVMFIDITFFSRSAEIANQYLKKGSKILVEGRLVFDQWTDQNGQKRSKHSITVETMKMLDSRSEAAPQTHQNSNSNNYGGGYNSNNQTQQNSAYQPAYQDQVSNQNMSQSQPKNSEMQSTPSPQQAEKIPSYDVDDDDIPF